MAITVPYTFSNATTAEAPEVNANFAAILSKAMDKTGDTATGTIAFTGGFNIGSATSAIVVGSQATNDLIRAASATTLGRIATANDSILQTNGSGVPSYSTTLPSAVQLNITSLGTVTAGGFPAANLTGTTLASGVTASSLTSVGTLVNLTVTNTITGSVSGSAATVTGATQAAITSAANLATVGTITSGVWNAGAVTSSGAVTAASASGFIVGALSGTYGNKVGADAGYVYIGIPGTTSSQKFYVVDSSGAAKFTVDGVGAGTIAGTLTVNGGSVVVDGSTNPGLSIKTSGTQKWSMYSDSSDVLTIREYGVANRLTIAAGGATTIAGTLTLPSGTVSTGIYFGTAVSDYGARIARYSSDVLLIGAPGTTSSQKVIITASNGGSIAEFRGDGSVALQATKQLYLDGGSDTYLVESGANVLALYAGGGYIAWTGIGTKILYPGDDNGAYLGYTSNRWAAVYAVNGTIQTSDRAKKTDFSTLSLGTDFLAALQPRSFRMRDEAEGTQRHGLIAQDVIAAAGGRSLLGILTGEREGEYGLNYAGFVPTLIAGWQSHDARIQALEAELAALKAQH